MKNAGVSVIHPDISVVVPVYNEGKSVGLVLDLLSRVNWDPYTVEVIVVDDGSTDNSLEVIKSYPFVRCVRHLKNRGKGAALRTGFARSRGRVVVVQDADMEYSPELIPELVRPILLGKSDVVFGSRFIGKSKGMALSHYFGNRLLSIAASALFDVPLTDVMTGSKAFSRSVVDTFRLQESGFSVEIELTSQSLQNGWRFHEVPIWYSYRTEGVSKIGVIDGFRSLFRVFLSSYMDREVVHH